MTQFSLSARPFSAEEVLRERGPLIRLAFDDRGEPVGAVAATRVPVSPERLWALIDDQGRYALRVPMVHKVQVQGSRASFHLRFRISLFSVGFTFDAAIEREPGRTLTLRWIEGEPRNALVRYALDPLDDGRATLLHTTVSFDVDSLGWLVKYFLKHHPEIRFGVMTGAAMTVLDAMVRASRDA